MGEVDVDIDRRLAHQLEAERTDAGAGIEDQAATTAGNFKARGVATVARIFGSGAGNRSSHAPEPDFQTIGQGMFPSGFTRGAPETAESTGRRPASTDPRLGGSRRRLAGFLRPGFAELFPRSLHAGGQFVGRARCLPARSE